MSDKELDKICYEFAVEMLDHCCEFLKVETYNPETHALYNPETERVVPKEETPQYLVKDGLPAGRWVALDEVGVKREDLEKSLQALSFWKSERVRRGHPNLAGRLNGVIVRLQKVLELTGRDFQDYLEGK